MKYNGQEVTEDFVHKVWLKASSVFTDFSSDDVKGILEAAEEVWQEKHADEFYPGQKVKDDTGREGEIILHPSSTHVWARFGSTKAMLNKARLTKTEED